MINASPLEPEARCDRCGRQGTVARVTRQTSPRTVWRYCSSCWPAARAEHLRGQAEESRVWRTSHPHNLRAYPAPSGEMFESRSWHDVVVYLRIIDEHLDAGAPSAKDDL